jgi:alpha-beta hydrolase superfamily lysophospholipase
VAPAVTARAAAACDDHGMTTLATSYADAPRWREYQPFFPPAMRCTPEATPTESRWRWRGLDVHLDRFEVPSSQVKVIVLHGAGANGRIMAPATVIARRHGYETVAPDLPGYGLTAVPRRRLTYQLWIDCAVDLIRAELARDDRPVVLFGVSLGGMLAYQAAATIARDEPALASRLRGLIATTLGDPTERATRRDLARYPLLGTAGLALLRVLATLTDGLPVPMRLVAKMHRISNDPALSALVMRDPHGGGAWVPARFLRTLMTTPPVLPPEAFTTCPVLLAHPGVDRMTNIEVSRRFFERLGGPKRLVVLDGASHMPTEQPGVQQLEDAVLQQLAALHPAT